MYFCNTMRCWRDRPSATASVSAATSLLHQMHIMMGKAWVCWRWTHRWGDCGPRWDVADAQVASARRAVRNLTTRQRLHIKHQRIWRKHVPRLPMRCAPSWVFPIVAATRFAAPTTNTDSEWCKKLNNSIHRCDERYLSDFVVRKRQRFQL